ncbi:MAG: hypothetical protein E7A91_11110, partial [Veillonella sp.]|nr:hypothetical protein [Veillonella sp.]
MFQILVTAPEIADQIWFQLVILVPSILFKTLNMKLEIWFQIDTNVFQIVVITLEIVVCKVSQAPEKSPVRSCINAVNKPKINCVAACSIPPIAVNT